MQYIISFLEGVITFISPCLLPLLPVYVSYLAGGEDAKKYAAIKNGLCFVLGFTLLFVTMGAFAGTLGALLIRYQTALNIVTGAIVILFGLNFLGIFRVNIFRGSNGDFIAKHKGNINGFTSILFGIVFAVGWTPCVGAFLGSALMLASNRGSAAQGILLLLCYSLGLGVPFIISAVLLDKLRDAFSFIKRHYRVINIICGLFLVLTGILMMCGVFGYWLSLLSF